MDLIKVENYINNLYDPNSGFFSFSKYSNPTLLSTDFAIMSLYLINGLERIDNKLIIKDLLRLKTPENSFIDFQYNQSMERGHKPDYILNQYTFFTLIALDQLGVTYEKLHFFDVFLDHNKLKEWLNSLNWSNFWYESNKIMFWLFFLSYIHKYGNDLDKLKAEEIVDIIFEILNKKQDKNTGFWGTNLNNNNLVDGCFGAAHILLFYEYYKREIPYKKEIIDNTLALHSKNGLVLNNEGGACEDYDVVEIYLRVLEQTDYRRNEVVNKIEQMKRTIISNQESDGGFPYLIGNRKYGIFKQKNNNVYRYSSWELMETKLYYSDTWATYFRILTVAIIDYILKIEIYKFQTYNLPGWGYIH